ncbi:hypothetical protein PHLGIDRAFT_366142 [Phlebiopsis gigantea 11061_1 CR5-6]|uniref:Uncharacterized protein n=1 Tax=Phlebiopsis gigantea (strain 11061_1 CR5-6) TaxID=745531 RepID=A0A0C3SCB3_PHLG1|nr:hypothetical protein PHLGIDRAFT_366142 [Phlebiopsis gigantea 11061_1 CR5-6]
MGTGPTPVLFVYYALVFTSSRCSSRNQFGPHYVLDLAGALRQPAPRLEETISSKARSPPASLERDLKAHIRGPAFSKPGFHKSNPTPMRVFVNAEILTPQESKEHIKQSTVDAAVFGVPWLANSDLQKEFEMGLLCNMTLDLPPSITALAEALALVIHCIRRRSDRMMV